MKHKCCIELTLNWFGDFNFRFSKISLLPVWARKRSLEIIQKNNDTVRNRNKKKEIHRNFFYMLLTIITILKFTMYLNHLSITLSSLKYCIASFFHYFLQLKSPLTEYSQALCLIQKVFQWLQSAPPVCINESVWRNILRKFKLSLESCKPVTSSYSWLWPRRLFGNQISMIFLINWNEFDFAPMETVGYEFHHTFFERNLCKNNSIILFSVYAISTINAQTSTSWWSPSVLYRTASQEMFGSMPERIIESKVGILFGFIYSI